MSVRFKKLTVVGNFASFSSMQAPFPHHYLVRTLRVVFCKTKIESKIGPIFLAPMTPTVVVVSTPGRETGIIHPNGRKWLVKLDRAHPISQPDGAENPLKACPG